MRIPAFPYWIQGISDYDASFSKLGKKREHKSKRSNASGLRFLLICPILDLEDNKFDRIDFIKIARKKNSSKGTSKRRSYTIRHTLDNSLLSKNGD